MNNRELKFRIWDHQENAYNKYEYWIDSKSGDTYRMNSGGIDYQLTNFCIQQYTGLKDKNGREIYEGDIITCHPDNQEKCIIDWSPDGIWWATDVIQPPEREHYGQELYMYPKCQVIGNIFENPDLLK